MSPAPSLLLLKPAGTGSAHASEVDRVIPCLDAGLCLNQLCFAVQNFSTHVLTLAQVAPSNPAVMDWLHTHGVSNEDLEKLTIGSRMLALLFPWRISVVLVPVATAVILTRIVIALTPYPGRAAFWAS